MGAYAKVDHALNLGARIRESFSLIKCNRLDTKRAQAKRTQAEDDPTVGNLDADGHGRDVLDGLRV